MQPGPCPKDVEGHSSGSRVTCQAHDLWKCLRKKQGAESGQSKQVAQRAGTLRNHGSEGDSGFTLRKGQAQVKKLPDPTSKEMLSDERMSTVFSQDDFFPPEIHIFPFYVHKCCHIIHHRLHMVTQEGQGDTARATGGDNSLTDWGKEGIRWLWFESGVCQRLCSMAPPVKWAYHQNH